MSYKMQQTYIKNILQFSVLLSQKGWQSGIAGTFDWIYGWSFIPKKIFR